MLAQRQLVDMRTMLLVAHVGPDMDKCRIERWISNRGCRNFIDILPPGTHVRQLNGSRGAQWTFRKNIFEIFVDNRGIDDDVSVMHECRHYPIRIERQVPIAQMVS